MRSGWSPRGGILASIIGVGYTGSVSAGLSAELAQPLAKAPIYRG